MADRPPREVRFLRTELEPLLHSDRCRVSVRLSRVPSETFVGTADGGCEGTETLRTAAIAAADALRQAMGAEDVVLEIKGVKLMEGIGVEVVMVSLAARYGGESRPLIGVCEGHQDPLRAAALAVLNASNRFLGVG